MRETGRRRVTVVSSHEGAATWVSLCRFIDATTAYEVRSFHQYDDHAYRAARSGRERLWLRLRTFVIFPLRFLWHARRIARESELVVVITAPFFMPVLAALMLSPRRTRRIALMWDIYPEALVAKGIVRRGGRAERFIKWVFGRALSRLDGVVFISEQHKDFLGRDVGLPATVPVIPIAAHSDPFIDGAPVAVPGTLEVTYCGTLGLMHDPSTFLGWLARYAERRDIAFSFYTSGAAKQKFEQDVRALLARVRSTTRVVLGDSLAEEEWIQVMKRAQVGLVFQDVGAGAVIFPSKITGILASGQAVLAVAERQSEIGRLILQHDCGWVVEPGDIGGFEVCVARLSQPEVLLGKRRNAFKIGHAVFGKLTVAKQWTELFDTVLGARPL